MGSDEIMRVEPHGGYRCLDKRGPVASSLFLLICEDTARRDFCNREEPSAELEDV